MVWVLVAVSLIAAGLAVALAQTHSALGETRRRLTDTQGKVVELNAAHESELAEHAARLGRLERERDRKLEQAHLGLVEDLLPTLDALTEATRHAREGAGADDLSGGLEMVTEQAARALSRHGITPIAPSRGDAFDPERHEAVGLLELEPGEDAPEDGTIGARMRTGWAHTSRVIRPAMVQVARVKAASGGEDEGEGVAFAFDEEEASEEEAEQAEEVGAS
jgi:molecular chaperone GrpE